MAIDEDPIESGRECVSDTETAGSDLKHQVQDPIAEQASESNRGERRLLVELEKQLTPEMVETITQKLEAVSNESGTFAMRLMSLQEFQQIMASGNIRGGACNLISIQKVRELASKENSDIYSDYWANATEEMTNWSFSKYPMITEQQMIRAYKDAIKAREKGREQLEELDYLLAEIVVEYVLNVYNVNEANWDYTGPVQMHFYSKDTKVHPLNDRSAILERVELALSSLSKPTPQQERNAHREVITDADKTEITNALQSFPDLTMDNRRTLLKFCRTAHNIGPYNDDSYAPYQILTVWPLDCTSMQNHSIGSFTWGDFKGRQSASKLLAVLSLTPNRAVYEELSQLMIESGDPDRAFPIATPTGELVFPSRHVISEVKDAKEAEAVRRQIITGEREENQENWQKEAKRLNSQRSGKDKLLRRKVTTWQDVAQDVANGMNNERDA